MTLVDEVDDGFSGESEAISFTPDADGQFVVTIDAFGSLQGDYKIFLVDLEAAYTDQSSVPNNDSQNFRACVPANAILVVLVEPEEDFDIVVNLNGPGGGTLIDQTDNGFSGEPEAVVFTDGETFDTEYAVIISVSGFGGQGGDFNITISSTSPDGVVIDGC